MSRIAYIGAVYLCALGLVHYSTLFHSVAVNLKIQDGQEVSCGWRLGRHPLLNHGQLRQPA